MLHQCSIVNKYATNEKKFQKCLLNRKIEKSDNNYKVGDFNDNL